MTSNPAIALRLQSNALVGRVAELGSFDDKAMNQHEQPRPDVDALLRSAERHQQWLRDARRFHTKNLFGLWLLLVVGVSVPIFVMFMREEFSLLVPVSGLLVFLVVLTGAYVFQEVARLHRRIDAVLKLIEEEERR
jgi:hypothetical protein